MQIETLFSMGQARVMMSVAGAMFAALALRLAWRVVAGVARRHGVAKTALLNLDQPAAEPSSVQAPASCQSDCVPFQAYESAGLPAKSVPLTSSSVASEPPTLHSSSENQERSPELTPVARRPCRRTDVGAVTRNEIGAAPSPVRTNDLTSSDATSPVKFETTSIAPPAICSVPSLTL